MHTLASRSALHAHQLLCNDEFDRGMDELISSQLSHSPITTSSVRRTTGGGGGGGVASVCTLAGVPAVLWRWVVLPDGTPERAVTERGVAWSCWGVRLNSSVGNSWFALVLKPPPPCCENALDGVLNILLSVCSGKLKNTR
eukprot:1161743-Pelagomonas_calceolata.AAC.7